MNQIAIESRLLGMNAKPHQQRLPSAKAQDLSRLLLFHDRFASGFGRRVVGIALRHQARFHASWSS